MLTQFIWYLPSPTMAQYPLVYSGVKTDFTAVGVKVVDSNLPMKIMNPQHRMK